MSDRLEQLRKLHETDPADPFLTYSIAFEHGKAGRLEDAIQWLDKTLALDGNYFYGYYQKALMLDQNGDTDAARRVLRDGIARAGSAGDRKATDEMTELLASLG